ncbi:hypothetical protein [Lentibacillus saliphilus]|uniref:hypothetical protein n=1 Tax=Lentibacillus saliphilus TaxID=2737028 RepID=UPI001C304358|nr:hypothetical protein [Lentibacillus saliphilus]
MDKQDQIMSMLQSIIETQDKQGKTLETHGQMLEELGQILTALRAGQEHPKVELDDLKSATAKKLDDIKEQMSDQSASIAILKEDVWSSKVDIHRIKTTMGINNLFAVYLVGTSNKHV